MRFPNEAHARRPPGTTSVTAKIHKRHVTGSVAVSRCQQFSSFYAILHACNITSPPCKIMANPHASICNFFSYSSITRFLLHPVEVTPLPLRQKASPRSTTSKSPSTCPGPSACTSPAAYVFSKTQMTCTTLRSDGCRKYLASFWTQPRKWLLSQWRLYGRLKVLIFYRLPSS